MGGGSGNWNDKAQGGIGVIRRKVGSRVIGRKGEGRL